LEVIKTKGIVIKSIKYAEQDKIITVLTRDLGKITVMAKGAMRPKGNLGVVTRFLSCSAFSLFKGRDMYVLRDAEFITNYPGIEADIEKLTYCSHFTEMIADIVQEAQPNPEAVDPFLYAVIRMNTAKPEDYESIRILFELRSVFTMGYTPRLEGCIACRSEIEEKGYFSITNDGLYCSVHKPSGSFAVVTRQEVEILRYIAGSSAKDLYRIRIPKEAQDTLALVSRLYVESKLEKKYTKLDMLSALRPKR
jgi:DNA repair protein RecO (recombination protein O)